MRIFILAATLASFGAPLISTPAWSQTNRPGDRPDSYASGVTVRSSRMHAGPDASYPAVRNFDPGLRVNVYGCLSDRSWCDVGYGPDRGWMFSRDLASDYRGRREGIDVIATILGIGVLSFNMGRYWDDHYRERSFYNDRYSWEQRYFDGYRESWGPRPDRSYWGNRTVLAYTMRRVWMRAGPDYDYPTLRRIARGARVNVYGCLRDWNWCDVDYRSDRGWVPASDLSADYRGRRQGFGSIAPYLGLGVLPFLFDDYWNDHYRGRPFYNQRDRWQRHYRESYKPIWGRGPAIPDGDRARQLELNRQRDEQNRLQLQKKQQADERARQLKQNRQNAQQNRQQLLQKQRQERARQVEQRRLERERGKLKKTPPEDKAATPDDGAVAPN